MSLRIADQAQYYHSRIHCQRKFHMILAFYSDL